MSVNFDDLPGSYWQEDGYEVEDRDDFDPDNEPDWFYWCTNCLCGTEHDAQGKCVDCGEWP